MASVNSALRSLQASPLPDGWLITQRVIGQAPLGQTIGYYEFAFGRGGIVSESYPDFISDDARLPHGPFRRRPKAKATLWRRWEPVAILVAV